MTKEDKDLLLKDLCARLPYGVKFKAEGDANLQEFHYIRDEEIYTRTHPLLPYWIETIKPYLRPMSSMTEEEVKEIQKINWQFCKFKNMDWYVGAADDGYCSVFQMVDILEYLNKHHFDYHGLIEKGLALEAPEGMY